jgi:predicted MFS family arabinose efflux permease
MQQYPTTAREGQGLSPYLLLLMAVTSGLAVAGNYYAQPLLSTIAADLGLSTAAATRIVTVAQLSYGAGLLLLVPLADLYERKQLTIVLLLLAAAGLALSALAPGLGWLLAGTCLAGLCSVVAQVLVPLAATLAAPEMRGRAVGVLMSGLLLGILLARVVAGGLSTLWGWRAVYACAAVSLLACALALAQVLPRYREDAGLSYGRLLASVLQLFVLEPVLRLRALLGVLNYVLFGLFWAPLAFMLAAPPYAYSDVQIGLFGLAGAAGVLAASWAGRLTDRGRGDTGLWIGLLGLLLSWLPLAFAQQSLLGLLLGVLLLDFAVQLVHVSNQNAVYALRPAARSRLNSGYMTSCFIGAASGSALATWVYPRAGWPGLVATGVAVALLALAVASYGWWRMPGRRLARAQRS